jgi:PqqD family protein of HPr-rel-A system
MYKATHPLAMRSWDDEFVVYHHLSGDTHLLGWAAGQLLTQLQQAPADAVTLSAALATQLGIVPDPQFKIQIETLLTELAALALIEHG